MTVKQDEIAAIEVLLKAVNKATFNDLLGMEVLALSQALSSVYEMKERMKTNISKEKPSASKSRK